MRTLPLPSTQHLSPAPPGATAWRQVRLPNLLYVLAFPLAMGWAETHRLDGPPICLFRRFTHLDCPSCGLTRAFQAMGRLDVVAAIHYNPLGPAVFILALGIWIVALLRLLTRGRITPPRWWLRHQYRLVMWAVVILLLVGFIRMVYEIFHPLPVATGY